MPSPKGKQSPKKSPKGSPKNGKISPKVEEEQWRIVPFHRQDKSEPALQGPLLSRIKRPLWYGMANRPQIQHQEWYWTPYCPLITSWGDILVTDPPNWRIMRYYYEPQMARLKLISIIKTKGEPWMIKETYEGKIAALLTCPNVKKSALTLYDLTKEQEDINTVTQKPVKLDFKYQFEPNPQQEYISKNAPPETNLPSVELKDEYTPIGICCNRQFIIVISQPLHKFQVFDPVDLHALQFKVESCYTDEYSCTKIATSGGCALHNDLLIVSCKRPNRLVIFWTHARNFFGKIDRIDIVYYADLGLDRLSIGEPFGLQVDNNGLIVCSDGQTGHMHVFNIDHRTPGPLQKSNPNGETCRLGSYKIDLFERVRLGHFSIQRNGSMAIIDRHKNQLLLFADRTIFRWLDDTVNYLEKRLLRPVVDKLVPEFGLPDVPERKKKPCNERPLSPEYLNFSDQCLVTERILRRYAPKDPVKEEFVEKKDSPKSKSPKGSPKSGGKGSPKSGKGSPKAKK